MSEASAGRVAVIGAGMAGLSCATALREAGVPVCVFDKSRGVSGRLSTRRTDDWSCDHGAQYFTARDPAFAQQVERWMAQGVVQRWQPRLWVMPEGRPSESADTLARHVGVPRMTAPAAALARELDVRTGTTVEALQRDGEGWRLVTREHGALPERFAAVMLAVPAPQAVPLLHGHDEVLGAVAASARMRGSWALMVQPLKDPGLPFDAAFVNDGVLRWVAHDTHKPGRSGAGTWLIHADPEWSEAHIEETPEAVAPLLLKAFEALGAPGAMQGAAWTAHRWRYADTDPPLMRGALWQDSTALGLCGDWLDAGKVEGAWLSGRALALQFQGAISSRASSRQ